VRRRALSFFVSLLRLYRARLVFRCFSLLVLAHVGSKSVPRPVLIHVLGFQRPAIPPRPACGPSAGGRGDGSGFIDDSLLSQDGGALRHRAHDRTSPTPEIGGCTANRHDLSSPVSSSVMPNGARKPAQPINSADSAPRLALARYRRGLLSRAPLLGAFLDADRVAA
jgi:hypothetical protein